jgi:signal transduction histidine kinase
MRRRLVLVAVLSLAAALVPVTAVFFVVLSRGLERDARDLLEARAAAVAGTVDVSVTPVAPRESTAEEALDRTAWVFDAAGRVVEGPAGGGPLDAVAVSLSQVRHPVRHDVADVALLAVPIEGPHGRAGAVVAALSRLPYEHAEQTALGAALALDVVVLVAVGLLTWRTTSAALAPVARMTLEAADWGAHDVTRRFALGPPTDELTALARTLDDLLERLAASLGHERRLTAEIAHELRTPLARIRAEAEVALIGRRPSGELRAVLREVVADSEGLSHTIEVLLGSARTYAAPGPSSCRAVDVLADAVVALAPADVAVLDHQDRLPDLAVERQTATRVLAPVLDNAVKYAAVLVTASIRREGRFAVIEIGDDGPGFARDESSAAFEPGFRGRASRGTAGVGLGLALARRLARDAGGDVLAYARADGGCVHVRLPLVAGDESADVVAGRPVAGPHPKRWRAALYRGSQVVVRFGVSRSRHDDLPAGRARRRRPPDAEQGSRGHDLLLGDQDPGHHGR